MNDFKARFDKFKNAHKDYLLSSSKREDGALSTRSSHSVNDDRPGSAQIIKRRIIRVDSSHERSTSRSQRNDYQTEIDQKNQQIADLVA